MSKGKHILNGDQTRLGTLSTSLKIRFFFSPQKIPEQQSTYPDLLQEPPLLSKQRMEKKFQNHLIVTLCRDPRLLKVKHLKKKTPKRPCKALLLMGSMCWFIGQLTNEREG